MARCDVEITWQGYRVRRIGVAANQCLVVPVGTKE
jgi:hypothetical protein